jgi:chromosome segregation protein
MGMAEVSITVKPDQGWAQAAIDENNPILSSSSSVDISETEMNAEDENDENDENDAADGEKSQTASRTQDSLAEDVDLESSSTESAEAEKFALLDIPGLLDAAEIQFTRRLYRSGESEYFINRVPCRLRDMIDIYRLIGLGSRGLSIVQQGQIGELISKKPIERRELLEEAAGISGFRTRIESSQRKLQRTLDNMARLNDIILEVEKQVKSLKRQANRARARGEIKETLGASERRLFDLRTSVLIEKSRALRLEQEHVGTELSAKKSSLSLLEAKQDEQRAALHELDTEIISLRRARDEIFRRIQKEREKLDTCRMQLARTQANLESVRDAISKVFEKERYLSEQRSELSSRLSDLQSRVENTRSQEDSQKEELLKVQEQLSRIIEQTGVAEDSKLVTFETLLDGFSERVTSLKTSIATLLGKIKSGNHGQAELVESLTEMESTVDLISEEKDKLIELRKTGEAERKEVSAKKKQELDQALELERQKQQQFSSSQRESAGAQSDLDSCQSRISGFSAELERLTTETESLQAQEAELKTSLSTFTAELNQLEQGDESEDNSSIELELQLAEDRVRELEEKRDELGRSLSLESQDASEVRRELDSVVQQENSIALKLERYDIELSMVLEEFRRKYGELSELPNEQQVATIVSESEDSLTAETRELEQEVKALLKRLEREGDVDPESIELFESENTRLEKMKAEHADLVSATDTLQDTIKQLKEISKTRFLETYEVVSARFEELIPRLFGGGSGHMTLVNPEDPLTSGVELSVRPPGKKITSMELMSGGEKALVATAVLIAVFLYKPGPLCVLDEVDAPLDDANLERFLNLIKEISSQTQFLIITHNKMSMAASDRLLGVTMQEQGISTALSVTLEDAEQEVEKWVANA